MESDRKPRMKDDKENAEGKRERSRSRSDRHRDGEVDSPELEDEQKKLNEEMEKRRRRVQKKEAEGEKHGEGNVDEPNSIKTWTLEGESDDEETGMDVHGEAYRTHKEDEAVLEVDSENETAAPALQNDGIDPLDAFLNSTVPPEVEELANVAEQSIVSVKKGSNKSSGRIIPGKDSDSDYGDIENNDNPLEDEDDDEFTKRVTNKKVEKLSLVDHSKIDYEPFRKKFYIGVKEISKNDPRRCGCIPKTIGIEDTWALGHSCAQQTAELKWGAAFVVCTPCRVIDLLCTNGGRIKNMQRVIYMVVDEADRMFDLGFELQINQIVQNIRSDHQTVLFSATFPHQAKVLACVLGGVTLPGTAAVVPGIGLALVGHKWVARAAEIAAAMNLQHNVAKIQVDPMPEHFEAELEINDIPQNARWKLERSTENKPIGMIS
ncbi:hypothetical protein EV1_023675 [Malus domestica]